MNLNKKIIFSKILSYSKAFKLGNQNNEVKSQNEELALKKYSEKDSKKDYKNGLTDSSKKSKDSSNVITNGCTGFVIIDENANKFIDFNSMYWVKELFILHYINKHYLENTPRLLKYDFVNNIKPKNNKEYFYAKLVMEKYDKLLLNHKPKNDRELLQIFIDLVSALKVMHSLNIWHRDLKLDNVMMRNKRAYLIDFSHSYYKKTEDIMLETMISTYGYQAPEVTQYIEDPFTKKYDSKQDIWALGIMFLELLTDFDIYDLLDTDDEKTYNEFYQNEEFKNKISEHYDTKKCSNFKSDYKELILEMLEQDPEKRICSENLYKRLIDMVNFYNINCSLEPNNKKLVIIPSNSCNIEYLNKKKEMNDIFDNENLESLLLNKYPLWNDNYDFICYVRKRCHFKTKFTHIFKFLYTFEKLHSLIIDKHLLFSILFILNVFINDDFKMLNYSIIELNLNGELVKEKISFLLKNTIELFTNLDFYNEQEELFEKAGYTKNKYDALIEREEEIDIKINKINKIFDKYINDKGRRDNRINKRI